MVDLFLLASLPFGAWRAVLPFVITFLAMDVHPRHARLHFGTRTDPARLAHFADAPDLSADAQLLIWKAILRAIKGAWVSWGKLERTASVPVRA